MTSRGLVDPYIKALPGQQANNFCCNNALTLPGKRLAGQLERFT